jgi:hypothetical protein
MIAQYTLRWQRLGDGSIIATDGSLWNPDEPDIEDWFTEYYWKTVRDERWEDAK